MKRIASAYRFIGGSGCEHYVVGLMVYLITFTPSARCNTHSLKNGPPVPPPPKPETPGRTPYKFQASRVDPLTKSANPDRMRSKIGKIEQKLDQMR